MSFETKHIIEDNDNFWFNDFSVIFHKNRFTEFFPSNFMSENEKLNSLLRFSIYITFLLVLYKKNLNLLFIPVVTALVTLYIYKFNNIQSQKEKFSIDREEHTIPTEDNPFMNTLLTDVGQYKERKTSCLHEEAEDEIEDNFNKNLFKDVNDLYSKNNSQRQFFTMPNTNEYGIKSGDTVKFANYLYNLGDSTCKEDTSKCTNSNSLFDKDLTRQKGLLLN